MKFKKLKNLNEIFEKYPSVISSSIMLDGKVYITKPLRFYQDDKDIIFEFSRNDYLGELNNFLEDNIGMYSMQTEDSNMLISDDYVIEQFNNVGCFVNNDFTIIRLSNNDYMINLVLATHATFLNALTIKNNITGKLAKESIMYLLQYQLLGTYVECRLINDSNYVKATFNPVDAMVISLNTLGTFGVHTLYTTFLHNIKDISDIDNVKVTFNSGLKGAYFRVIITIGDDKVSYILNPLI